MTHFRTAAFLLFLCCLGSCQCSELVSNNHGNKRAVGCNDNPAGTCVSMVGGSCKSGWKSSYSGCGFLEKCCYPQKASSDGDQSSSPDACGRPVVSGQSRIVGGEKTDIKSYPWQVSIQDDGHFCGGSIISDRWVVTAAHCVDENRKADQLEIRAGYTDKDRGVFDSPFYKVKKMILHPGYNERSVINDIALLKLTKRLDITSSKIRTICLPDPGQTFNNEVCTATGWGVTHEDGDHNRDNLRQVTLTVHDRAFCKFSNQNGAKPPYGKICAGDKEGGVDTCQGDSGGPLACKRADGSWALAGITSTGTGCGREMALGLYTDVPHYLDWISQTMDKYGR